MVLPFGVGIGDVIQVANLTRTVVSELKKTGDAAPEYQVLVIDLENLERILTQINELQPAEHNLTQLEPIRATIKACQLPLRDFLDKISKFEGLLGIWNFKGRSLNGIGRRIQWKVAYKSDVNELRATLAGHVNVLTLHIVLQSLKSTLTAESDRAGNFQTLRGEIRAQHAILESLDRRQLEDPNNKFEVENAFNVLIDRLDHSTTLDADMQMILVDQAKVLQSIESRSQTIHLGQGEMLRNLQSGYEHMKQHGTSNSASHAESEPGGTANPGQPSSKLTTSLKALTIILAGSTAVLAYGSTIKPTGMFYAPVGPSFGPPIPSHDARPLKSLSSRTHVNQSADSGQDSLSLDLHPDKQPKLRYLPQEIVKQNRSAATQSEEGAPPDMLHCAETDKNDFKSTDSTPVRRRGAFGCHIPSHLSFIVRIEPLSPDYGTDGQPPPRTKEGYFLPPDKRNGYKRGEGPALLLRWVGGRLSQVGAHDPIRRGGLRSYRTATVFTQFMDTPHLLAVPFDAREQHVREIGWRRLTFNHNRIPGTHSYYSHITCLGLESCIAAPGSAHWMPQLVADFYQYRPRTQQTRIQAGLVGNLPLLIALAAFSTPPNATALDSLLTSVQPGGWNPHAHPYPSGHIPERGMVVTVSFDPYNPENSVKESLDKLQNGAYGPFYGPERPPQPSSTASST